MEIVPFRVKALKWKWLTVASVGETAHENQPFKKMRRARRIFLLEEKINCLVYE
jgi:hypothetical protein